MGSERVDRDEFFRQSRRKSGGLFQSLSNLNLKSLKKWRKTCCPSSAVSMENSGRTVERFTAIYVLVGLNVLLYILDHIVHFPFVRQLYLNHRYPQWWQYGTSMFCHNGWDHLSNNLFMLYVFGKMVEEEEGALGLTWAYLLCGFVSSVISKIWLGSNYVTLGASGAVFGLLVLGLLSKLRLNWRMPLEALAIGPFVWGQITREISMTMGQRHMHGMAAGYHSNINHVAHLAV
eukprot:jgi/Bigna1/137797/aug1.41_g12505